MKKIEAQIVADSISPQGHRITSFLLTYPRFIHGEIMTHRMFSRNSASSRAIPVENMLRMVEEDPFIPIAWQKAHKGMQGTEYFTEDKTIHALQTDWLRARDKAVEYATYLNEREVTKQLCNRLLEPFMWHTVLVTATDWENFFELRCPQYYFEPSNKYFRSKKDFVKEWSATFKVGLDIPNEASVDSWSFEQWQERFNHSQAEIHIQALAESLWDAMNDSTPKELKAGGWHIPFGDRIDGNLLVYNSENTQIGNIENINKLKIQIATARCARLSYMTFDGEIDYEKDIKLHDRLLKEGHFSPFEHCARAMNDDEYYLFSKGMDGQKSHEQGWCNNYRGWVQYRYLIENNHE